VLSLAKLAGTDQRYYLELAERRVDHTESVASGAEDYYLSGPEAAGTWVGSAARSLRLAGEVAEPPLRAVLSHVDPTTRQRFAGVRTARVPGFDLMFSVPKSASILFGLGGPQMQAAVLEAQEEAVRAGLAYLERRACRTRRGAGGVEVIQGEGFVAAAFRHRTSRAGDPQVHTHVLVANATRIHDGTWGTLDGRAIYAEARTAGFVHEAVFRQALTHRVGVRWGPVRNGIADIEGIPKAVIDAFSRRKAEIDAQVAEWGADSAQARQSAAVQTRSRKDYGVTPEQLAPEWRQRASELGFETRHLPEVCGRQGVEAADPTDLDELAGHLVSSDGLTSQQSSFDRRDVLRAVAEASRQGASLREMETFVDRFAQHADVVTLADAAGGMRRQDVIRRRDGRIVSAIVESPRYSTVELLATEQRIVEAAISRRATGAGVASEEWVERSLGHRPSMGDDQAVMVRRLCRGGEGIQVVVGPPGTGKTFALDAAREAWEATGLTVYGAAVARRAAMELSHSAGMEATSVAALLVDLRHGGGLLTPRTVLVVDEAGMLGTRALAEIVAKVDEAGAKLVLVGDPQQLPEIDAGGAFRALVARTDPIVLTENRRQRREPDRRLLELWRAGHVRDALVLASEQGDLVLAPTFGQVEERLVVEYCAALTRGDDAVMIGHRRADVRRLNETARRTLKQSGAIEREEFTVGERSFARGDRVLLRRNCRRLGVENGTRGRVAALDAETGKLEIVTSDGRVVTLPRTYLLTRTRSGGASVEHGYALTAHAAQGMTADRAFVLGSELAYREWGYVAWSRARLGTRYYAVGPEALEEHHTAAAAVEPFDEVVRVLDRSEAQELASAFAARDHSSPTKGPTELGGARLRHSPVLYLEEALGPRPDSLLRRLRWDRASRRIERFRAGAGIADQTSALGPEPTDGRSRVAWLQARRDLRRSQVGLGREVREGSRAIER
jgi:conjugative relaxase-like TrwC/TraI family protein